MKLCSVHMQFKISFQLNQDKCLVSLLMFMDYRCDMTHENASYFSELIELESPDSDYTHILL